MTAKPKTSINLGLVDHYLSHITVSWFGRHDLPSENVEDYGEFLRALLNEAQRRGHVDDLALGLDYALAQPDLEALDIGGVRYPFDDAELRPICEYVRKNIKLPKVNDASTFAVVRESAYTWNERDRERLSKPK